MRLTALLFGLLGVLQTAPASAEDGAKVPVPGEPMAKACQVAYRQQDLPFVLRNCPEEAWALARAQCEREPEKVKPAYVDFCNRFYTGSAPSYGN